MLTECVYTQVILEVIKQMKNKQTKTINEVPDNIIISVTIQVNIILMLAIMMTDPHHRTIVAKRTHGRSTIRVPIEIWGKRKIIYYTE